MKVLHPETSEYNERKNKKETEMINQFWPPVSAAENCIKLFAHCSLLRGDGYNHIYCLVQLLGVYSLQLMVNR